MSTNQQQQTKRKPAMDICWLLIATPHFGLIAWLFYKIATLPPSPYDGLL